MTAILIQQAHVPWGVTVSAGGVYVAQASPIVLVAPAFSAFFQVMAFRLALAANFYASVAGAYDIMFQSVGGLSPVNIFDAPVVLPAAAGSGLGSLYDSGWVRFDPTGFGSAVNGIGGNLQLAWLPAAAFTGLLAIQFAVNHVPV